jgi:Ca2+-binding EF-hand superfamily protein
MTMTSKSTIKDLHLLTKEAFTEVETIFDVVCDAQTKIMPYAKLPVALKALGMTVNDVDDPSGLAFVEINLDKFVEIVWECMRKPNWAANEMNEAFGLFDKDMNGQIDASELRRVFAKLGENIVESELAEQLREFDIDGDTEVSVLWLIISSNESSHFNTKLFICCVIGCGGYPDGCRRILQDGVSYQGNRLYF